ncbi:leukemia inhibitory factor receptor isoform X1 [Anolis carolinensis]|uniref:leukemia inhibitory factor receptor isoform X1 n=1 Tax=Anolis carolinensis TaxID=28377 RepID=UPI002F2B22E5
MWIYRIQCCLLAVAHLYLLNHLVYSQESDSLYKPQNLTCVTHKLVDVICTWTTESPDDFGYRYKFCYTSSMSLQNCSITEEKSQTFPLILFDSVEIEISTFNSSKNMETPIATNQFVITENDINFIPPAPRIHRLTPDYISDTLELEWYDGGSDIRYSMDATWEIQILYKDPMEEVALITYKSKLNGNDTLLHWKWTSNIPFNCTTHYVRIRCFLHENMFFGKISWSEWSKPADIPGKDTDYTRGKMYPTDKVVLVGSNVTFCCVWRKEESNFDFHLSPELCPPQGCQNATLSNWSKLIQVQNVPASQSSGRNIICRGKNSKGGNPIYGTVLFSGYPPDVPQNVSCETKDLKEITCKWEPGRPTSLDGSRKTSYTLSERISGITIPHPRDKTTYQCNFPVLNNQTTYDITIHATNRLGKTNASLYFSIKTRIHPSPPTDLTVTDNSPTNISLSWHLPGNFMKTQLKFQIKVSNSTFSKLKNVHLDGTENSLYTISMDNLHPYTFYTFQVRCSANEPFFWKWGNWSKGLSHQTLEAPPARKLDVWREKDAEEGTVIIFWKPLSILDSNGVIEGYEISWIVPEMPIKKQSVPEFLNNTKIKLGSNDYIFTVVAKNKAGLSPPSLINSAEIPVGPVPTESGIATGDGVQITWLPDPSVTCGYKVRWCYEPGPCTAVSWETFPSNVTNPIIRSTLFQPGVRYHFSVYGCKDNGYQLLKYVDGYTKELEPAVAPVFNVMKTTSDSISIKWQDIPTEEIRGFIKGYLLHFGKGEEGNTKPKAYESGYQLINITNLKQDSFRISNLQGKTGYHLNLSGYTAGGIGPATRLFVVTKENALGLIIAILIPMAVVVVLAVVTIILCYRKREWIKETFYPDIPNPENCKALDFPKDSEGNPNSKTLEMNPCTPNNIEVVETQSSCLKIEEAVIKSPVTEELPEDGFDSESESHIVVSYCPSIIEEELSNPPTDGSVGSSQVVYIDIQTMYPSSDKMKEDLEIDCVASAGYKPQMQLPKNTEETSSAEEDLEKAAGYRPQVNAPSWNTDCPDSPVSVESNNENVSFGSPCSINSRQFLIPPKDEDSPEVINTGWSFSNFFHNKPND